jgi:hypothetical protein
VWRERGDSRNASVSAISAQVVNAAAQKHLRLDPPPGRLGVGEGLHPLGVQRPPAHGDDHRLDPDAVLGQLRGHPRVGALRPPLAAA